jgi:predicted GIY-YIG superfamily endonuclease
MAWTIYILECAGGRLYTGVTTDLDRRIAAHRSGKGAKFTRAFGVRNIVYSECCANRGVAQAREAVIKKLSRVQKLMLVKSKT